MATRRQYLIRAAINFGAIIVLAIVIYPFLKPEQRRGAYIVTAWIVGVIVVAGGILVAIKYFLDRRKSSGGAPRPPRAG
ncbi:MAG: hypothetical protein K8W52_13665 [Deltaproteobacteria bacterium]|nr:hypothetical protein [Deltaproteobacteria bacterium]